MKTVGQALVAGLKARGIDIVFGIPGVHTGELYRGLGGGALRHVTPRHEQAAGFMADGYARVAGRPAAVFVITGPGLTNVMTAIAQARADSVPMLVISGVNRRASLGRGLGLLHELPDQSALIAKLCPTERLDDPAQLGAALDRAFDRMLSGRPCPVHLEVPTDVMGLPCPGLADPLPLPALPQAGEAALARAAGMLDAAGRVVILAGGGMKRADAPLRALAERLDAPVVLTANARGLLHGHGLVVPASPSLDPVRELIGGADLVLALGTELGPTDYDMYARGGMPDLSGMIRVDLCAEQLARHPAALAIRAEAGGVAAALADRVARKAGDGAARAAAARDAARAALAGLHPAMPGQLAVIEAIRAALPGALIVGDSTQPVYAGNLFYDHDLPGGWFNAATGFGALGYGVGAAIGAALAAPDRRVVCLVGDGGLQFDPAELRVAVDEGAAVTFIVWNNQGYREIAEYLRDTGVEVVGCSPSPLKLAGFAAACDLPFVSLPAEAAELAAELAKGHPGPRVIELRVES